MCTSLRSFSGNASDNDECVLCVDASLHICRKEETFVEVFSFTDLPSYKPQEFLEDCTVMLVKNSSLIYWNCLEIRSQTLMSCIFFCAFRWNLSSMLAACLHADGCFVLGAGLVGQKWSFLSLLVSFTRNGLNVN